jgi:anti-sigma B factor antagonist
MQLNISDNGDKLIGAIIGRLDTVNSEKFSKDMQPLIDGADRHIELECSALEYISSSGLRLFLTLRKQVAAKGGKLTIRNINNEIREVFTITGFFNLFEVI